MSYRDEFPDYDDKGIYIPKGWADGIIPENHGKGKRRFICLRNLFKGGMNMAYQRKTKDVWVIESNYGYGWEEESSYDKYEDAKADLKEYRIAVSHHFGVCRVSKRRERI